MKTKSKKGIRWAVIVLIVLCAAGALFTLGVNVFVKASVKSRILSAEQAEKLDSVDCILVLGCLVQSDGVPSDMLADRLTQGIDLYQSGVSRKLLMSGDHGRDDYDEVNSMKNYAISAGVPSSDVFMDHAGFSTYDSIYRTKAVFEAKKVVIVTQRYHLYRALYIARRLGLDAYGVPSDLRTYYGQSKRDAREVLARVKDFVYVIVRPKPTFLGDAIPVNGDGDATDDGHTL